MSAREVTLLLIITSDDSTGPHLRIPTVFVWGPDEVLTTYGHWVLVRTLCVPSCPQPTSSVGMF